MAIIDSLCKELEKRQKAYEKLNHNFGFLRNLRDASSDEIRNNAENIQASYPEDLDDLIKDELLQFSELLKTNIANTIDNKKGKEAQFYALMRAHQKQSVGSYFSQC